MDAQAFKLELIKLLLETDELTILEKVKRALSPQIGRKKEPTTIVGFRPNGDPISQDEFIQEIKISMEQRRKGEVVSHEDLIKEAENW